MAQTIDKIVKSKYAPKQTNVIWVDTSGDTPVEKHFIKGKWREMSGGGAGSPNPTEADATKVWQVTPVQKGTKTESIELINASEVLSKYQNIIYYREVENSNLFIGGANCKAVINGVEYTGIAKEEMEMDIGEVVKFTIYDNEEVIFSFRKWESATIVFEISAPVAQGDEYSVFLSVEQSTPIYDYNWAPGVKIPIPTAEDEGKILVVTKVEGDNTSIIVPEQEVPADENTSLTDVDLKYFVPGNTVTATVVIQQENKRIPIPEEAPTENPQTFTATGVIAEDGAVSYSNFSIGDSEFYIVKIDNLLYTNAYTIFGSDSTIKLEYIESIYEYQLQENSSTSNVLWPAMYEVDGNEIIATFVPEDVEPNTWCMVCGPNNNNINICLPVLVLSYQYQDYVICNNSDFVLSITSANNGKYLNIAFGGTVAQ